MKELDYRLVWILNYRLLKDLYNYRFELFAISQLLILFGSLLVPIASYDLVVLPILLTINVFVGLNMVRKSKRLFPVVAVLSFLSLISVFWLVIFQDRESNAILRLFVYLLFYVVITFEIIKQVWTAKWVNRKVIFGLFGGYLSLGLIFFLLFMTIETMHPGSFHGSYFDNADFDFRSDSMMYFSYITLLTIGYGDIVPVTVVAQKTAVLAGLVGQFYMVVITAVVIEKYIKHSSMLEDEDRVNGE